MPKHPEQKAVTKERSRRAARWRFRRGGLVGGISLSRFESFQPSHAVLLFRRVGRLCGRVPTFRALARTDSVSGAY